MTGHWEANQQQVLWMVCLTRHTNVLSPSWSGERQTGVVQREEQFNFSLWKLVAKLDISGRMLPNAKVAVVRGVRAVLHLRFSAHSAVSWLSDNAVGDAANTS